MRYQPVDIGLVQSIFLEGFVNDSAQGIDRDLENFIALHLEIARSGLFLRMTGGQIRHVEQILILPIRMNMGTHQTGLVSHPQNHSARAITKQHTGRAIRPIDETGIHLAAHNEHPGGTPSTDVLIGDAQGKDEAGTGSLHVEGRAIADTKAVLQETGGTGKNPIGCPSPHDDQIKFIRFKSCRL